jgi:hypothetical protein
MQGPYTPSAPHVWAPIAPVVQAHGMLMPGTHIDTAVPSSPQADATQPTMMLATLEETRTILIGAILH